MSRKQRKEYLRTLGIKHTPRGRFCPQCRHRVFAVVSPTSSRFLVTHRGRVSCP